MGSKWMIGLLLAGLVGLGTGASMEGIGQARQWQRQADLAMAVGQWDAAYVFYRRIAEAFPESRHGRRAAGRARVLRERMLRPDRSPGEESPTVWTAELADFLTWP